jgi:type II secretory pathway pseudopilin PulG
MAVKIKAKALSQESGLTLIEVIFAIVLFAGAMITLLGLQSSNMSRTREDRDKIKAMLAAREILSAIEIQDEALETGTKEGSVEEIFGGLVMRPPRDAQEKDSYADLVARLEVANVGLPNIGESALQKITVTVSWGSEPFEQFKTTFFTPGTLLSNSPSPDS